MGVETAHHVLNQVAQNRTTFLNSLATDQNAVPFLTVETAAEKLTVLSEREAEFTTLWLENQQVVLKALSHINVGFKHQLVPD